MVRTLELAAVDPVAGRAAKCKRLVSQAVLFFLLHLMNATEAETLRARHGLGPLFHAQLCKNVLHM